MRWIALGLALLSSTPEDKLPKVLFLTRSRGFAHAVVKRTDKDTLAPAEKHFLEAAKGKFDVDVTQDDESITREKLAGYKAVVFYTTGELAIDKDAFIEWVKNGGGFVGIHCATDTFYKFAPYGEMIGGYFDGHPWTQDVKVKVEDKSHPATKHLGDSFGIKDEIYQFRDWERGKVHVLLSIDVTSVDLTKKEVKRTDGDFAVAWTKNYGKGRVFYTSLGHREEVWADERFRTHLMNGIAWAASP